MTLLDIHGQNQFEARVNIEVFIKQSYELRDYNVLISHGYGKFILKKLLDEILKTNKYVEDSKFAPPSLGGAGVTWVIIKHKKKT